MSIFSDYRVGALTDEEFWESCKALNAQEKYEMEHEYDMDEDEDEESEVQDADSD